MPGGAPGMTGSNKQQQQQPMMNPQAAMNPSQLLNHHLSAQQGMPGMPGIQMQHQMPQYGHDMHQGMNLNGVPKPQDVVYLGAQPPMGVMPHQSQFARTAPAVSLFHYFCITTHDRFIQIFVSQISSTNTKKLWEKGSISDVRVPTTGSLGPLQLHGGNDHAVWRDLPWSAQTDNILQSRRAFAQGHESMNPVMSGILRYETCLI